MKERWSSFIALGVVDVKVSTEERCSPLQASDAGRRPGSLATRDFHTCEGKKGTCPDLLPVVADARYQRSR